MAVYFSFVICKLFYFCLVAMSCHNLFLLFHWTVCIFNYLIKVCIHILFMILIHIYIAFLKPFSALQLCCFSKDYSNWITYYWQRHCLMALHFYEFFLSSPLGSRHQYLLYLKCLLVSVSGLAFLGGHFLLWLLLP